MTTPNQFVCRYSVGDVNICNVDNKIRITQQPREIVLSKCEKVLVKHIKSNMITDLLLEYILSLTQIY